MRRSAIVGLCLLMLPAGVHAQRVRLPGGRGATPASPAPLPPQAPVIARQLAYRRAPLSIESYPLLSFVQAPAFAGSPSHWTSFGSGARADYRITRFVSATLDFTESLLGAPMRTETVELGTRLRPERTERRIYPFADLRVGYMRTTGNVSGQTNPFDPFDVPISRRQSFRHGFGAVGGVGMEYALTSSISLTTAGTVMRSRVTDPNVGGANLVREFYSMTQYRWTVGLRYNRVRTITASATPSS